MAYDESKDKIIKSFSLDTEKDSLVMSLVSYNNGSPKLQITREFTKPNGDKSFGRMGRLTLEEVEFIRGNIEEVLKLMRGEWKQKLFRKS